MILFEVVGVVIEFVIKFIKDGRKIDRKESARNLSGAEEGFCFVEEVDGGAKARIANEFAFDKSEFCVFRVE